MKRLWMTLSLGALAAHGALTGCSAADDLVAGQSEQDGDNTGASTTGTTTAGTTTGTATTAGQGDFGASTTGGYAPPYYGDGDGDSDEDQTSQGEGGAPNDRFEAVGTNPFVAVDHDPLSTFAVDVDSASYDLFRTYTKQGSEIQAESIRLEEFVNYFSYDYPAPDGDASEPFAVHLSAAPNLATRDTRLLRVGIQGMIVEEIPAANLVFLVDVSGSMSGNLATVRHLLTETLEQLSPQDTVSIVTYASNPGTLLPATPLTEKQTIVDAIASLTSGGATNGSGGINAAYAEAEGAFKEDGINHIVMCTDGDFNLGLTSNQDLEALIEEKRKTGITLTAVGFGGGNFNDAMMERISNIGNGIYSYVGSTADATKYAQEKMLQSMIHIAQDVKIQVEFNADHVYAYRLLGYENRAIADDDFRNDIIDAGEIGSGHRVTALYELAFSEADLPSVDGDLPFETGVSFDGISEVDGDDFVLVKVRYKTPGASETDAAFEVSQSLTPQDVLDGLEGTQSDFQYAAAVATYAEILKDSPFADRGALDAVAEILSAQKGRDSERGEFYDLFVQANTINGF